MKLKVTAISLALSLASFQGIAKDSVDQLAEKMDAIAHKFNAPDGPGCAMVYNDTTKNRQNSKSR